MSRRYIIEISRTSSRESGDEQRKNYDENVEFIEKLFSHCVAASTFLFYSFLESHYHGGGFGCSGRPLSRGRPVPWSFVYCDHLGGGGIYHGGGGGGYVTRGGGIVTGDMSQGISPGGGGGGIC